MGTKIQIHTHTHTCSGERFLKAEDKCGCSAVMSAEMLWPCQFLDGAFKIGEDPTAELVLAEDADGSRRSSVKSARNVPYFFTHKTENTPQAQESSSSLHSDYVSIS